MPVNGDKPVRVVMVAEKPSLARTIAAVLSSGSASTTPLTAGGGSGSGPPTLQWSGRFGGREAVFVMTSVCGHVFALDFPAAYNDWGATEPDELFTCATKRIEASPKMRIPAHLAKEARHADFAVLWLDCDLEGENICYEVLDCILPVMRSGVVDAGANSADNDVADPRIFRAHFSSLAAADLRAAFANLGRPNKAQALAVDARQEIDLRIGCAFTRFQTRYFQGKYGDLDSTLISYGPCQTPTLGFCVARHDLIQSFKPEPFWTLRLTAKSATSTANRTINLVWARGRLFDRDVASMFHADVRASTEVEVTHADRRITDRQRPIGLNTCELMRVCSRRLNIGPQQAMHVAERLYTAGYISYPRTESTHYADNFNVHEVLAQHASHPEWGRYVTSVLLSGEGGGWRRPRPGHDAGDHPPITPVRAVPPGTLEHNEWRVYEYIARHFLASVSPNCKIQSVTYRVQTRPPDRQKHQRQDGQHDQSRWRPEVFGQRFQSIKSAGFTAVLRPVVSAAPSLSSSSAAAAAAAEDDDVAAAFLIDRSADADDEDGCKDDVEDASDALWRSDSAAAVAVDPQLNVGDRLVVADVQMVEGKTTPPGYLTESDLITLMERNGIGTDASIPVHIGNICTRNFVTLDCSGGGRRLVPTSLGTLLVHGYLMIDAELVEPRMRSAVERQLASVARGVIGQRAALAHTLTIFAAKFAHFAEHIGRMDQLFEVAFTTLAQSGRPFSRCGHCNRYMRLITHRPQRLFCMHCEQTLALPVAVCGDDPPRVHSSGAARCPLDNFELLYVGGGGGGRGVSFAFCPFCFNHPPFEDMVVSQSEAEIRTAASAASAAVVIHGGSAAVTSNQRQARIAIELAKSCLNCSHPTCQHGRARHAVADCSACHAGVLVLEVGSAPRWRLICTDCSTVVPVLTGARSVTTVGDGTAERDFCVQCGSRRIAAMLPNVGQDKTTTSVEGCLFCDETLARHVKAAGQPTVNRQQGRHGRGRGRGRRGRGARRRFGDSDGSAAAAAPGGGNFRPRDKMAQLANYFV